MMDRLADISTEKEAIDWVLTSMVKLKTEEKIFDIEGTLATVAEMRTNMDASLGNARGSMDSIGNGLKEDFKEEANTLDHVLASLERSTDSFHRNSDELQRVGLRIGLLEKERDRLENCSQLLQLVQELEVDFIGVPDYQPVTIEDETRALLPPSIRDADWILVCARLQELRLILADVNSQDVQKARANITTISDEIESRLLIKFEMVLSTLAAFCHEVADDSFWTNETLVELLKQGKIFAHCLLCFNNGFAVRKRYLYISLRRIQGIILSASADLGLVDHVSQLMHILRMACREEFQLIRQIFPAESAGRVCHLLLQRMYSDPTINLLEKVATVLNPKEPSGLGETLDLLVVIREKFTALQITVTECATAPHCFSPAVGLLVPRSCHGNEFVLPLAKEGPCSSSVLLTENDCHQLMNDLMEQTLQVHLLMYHQNIMIFISQQYGELIVGAFKDLRLLRTTQSSAISSFAGGASTTRIPPIQSPWMSRGGCFVPEIIPEYFRDFVHIKSSIGTESFCVDALGITADALRRLYGIGRTDKDLSERVREIFQCEIAFLVDFHLVPWIVGIELQLVELSRDASLMSSSVPLNDGQLRQSLSRNKVSRKGAEAVESLSLWSRAYDHYQRNFEDAYINGKWMTEENEVLLCREIHKNTFSDLGKRLESVLLLLAHSICENFAETLDILQSRHDYEVQRQNPSLACTTVCSEIRKFHSTLRMFQETISSTNRRSMASFWTALSAKFTAVLITHIAAQQISQEGATALEIDLVHYQSTTEECSMSEAALMMGDLCVMTSMYKVPSTSVPTEVQELTRLFDEAVVAILVGSRGSNNSLWYHNYLESSFTGSIPHFPWEGTNVGEKRGSLYGPRTLRRRRYLSQSLERASQCIQVTDSQYDGGGTHIPVMPEFEASERGAVSVVSAPGFHERSRRFWKSLFV